MFFDPLNLFTPGRWAEYQITAMTHDPLDVRKLGPKLWEMRRTSVVTAHDSLEAVPQASGCMFRWTWDLGDCALLVPTGYRSDGASVPKPYRNIVDPEAAFDWSWPHDIFYQTHGGDRAFKVWNEDGTVRLETLTNAVTGEPMSIDRCRADALLFCGWVSEGMKRFEAVAGYDALRQFGTQAWEAMQ